MTDSLLARGRVVAVHANDSFTVECAAACPGCRCGRYLDAPTRRIELPLGRSERCAVGRRLAISIDAAALLRVSLWLYGLPWLTLLLGTLLGAWAGRADTAALIGAATGLLAGMVSLKLLAQRVSVPHLEVRADE